jgi:copper(I)-binding protein
VAAGVEMIQMKDGKPTPAKEVLIAAFDRLDMSPDSTYLALKGLKKPLAAGDTVSLVLTTDGGERLAVTGTVK